ncbi:hypothetical protein NC652_025628 [Populus alba x Populus x berolinensis]|nr:hypothetical protein NC652_025628 [Populus alba x Populus x berolinensis]
MFQPKFCEMLINEVPYNLSEHYEQFGVVLDDSGLETMLEKLMDDYLCPMSRVLLFLCSFLGCGLTLDSHHGSVVEYREHMDIELGRKILIITTFRDEQFFVMVAIGHGARATISGHQVNLVIWCRSTFHFSFSTAEETSNDFSAGVEIVDPRKKKDNACQLLLRTGIAEEGCLMVSFYVLIQNGRGRFPIAGCNKRIIWPNQSLMSLSLALSSSRSIEFYLDSSTNLWTTSLLCIIGFFKRNMIREKMLTNALKK